MVCGQLADKLKVVDRLVVRVHEVFAMHFVDSPFSRDRHLGARGANNETFRFAHERERTVQMKSCDGRLEQGHIVLQDPRVN